MKIVCIGDSLTFGYGVSTDKNWISRLNKREVHEFINKGINGDTTGGMLSRFYRDVIDLKPGYVFIMGGVNDLITGDNLNNVKSNIMSMVHQAYHNRIIPIIGVPMMGEIENIRPDWKMITDFAEVKNMLIEYKNWIELFSKVFKTSCIDFYEVFENEKLSGSEELFIDGLHPNDIGQEVIERTVGRCFDM